MNKKRIQWLTDEKNEGRLKCSNYGLCFEKELQKIAKFGRIKKDDQTYLQSEPQEAYLYYRWQFWMNQCIQNPAEMVEIEAFAAFRWSCPL